MGRLEVAVALLSSRPEHHEWPPKRVDIEQAFAAAEMIMRFEDEAQARDATNCRIELAAIRARQRGEGGMP